MGDERLTVETPERVALEYEIAGLGSRFAAALVDGFIQSALLGVLLGALLILGSLSCDPILGAMERHARGEADAVAALMTGRFMLVMGSSLFGLQLVYHVLFEGLQGGRTPGKRLLGIRVVHDGGAPLHLGGAVVRNLLRPVDFLPLFFGLGGVVALVTRRTQRLGDLLARTMVVRERAQELAETFLPAASEEESSFLGAAPLSPDESLLLTAFLDRREQLDPQARERLAARLTRGLKRRHGDLGEPRLAPDAYLERLAAERRP